MSDLPHITQNFGRPSYRPAAPAGLDPDMRRMAVIAAGIAGAVALAIGVTTLSHRMHHGVPVIQAEAGPVRVKPADPGGMTVAGAEEPTSGVEALAPAPEKPAIRALHAKTHKPASPAAAHPAPATPATTPTVIAAEPTLQRASVLQPLAHPLPSPVPVSAPLRTTQPGATVQLAAFETEQAAQQEWGKLSAKIPGLFNGHRPVVQRAEVAGRTVYRLRTGGFADTAAATEFCAKVRAHGGDCSLANF